MLPGGVIEHLDIIEHVLARLGPGPIDFPTDALALEQVEEALGHRVVMAVAASAHRRLKIVVLQERGPFHAGELRPLV